jgi:GABA(A) receptor-associated protein
MTYVPFKTRYTYEQRRGEYEKIIKKHADKIPIIIEKNSNNTTTELDRHKFLVYRDATVGQFMYVVRKRMKLRREEALFLYMKDNILAMGSMLGEVYRDNKDEDGFLYITYTGENAFG